MTRRAPSTKAIPGAPGAPDSEARLPFLREITRRGNADEHHFPFSVPGIRALVTLPFPTPVTFLVGESGPGKSTLLEGIAAAALPTVGANVIAELAGEYADRSDWAKSLAMGAARSSLADMAWRLLALMMMTPVVAVPYEELEHVQLTRGFLHDPAGYLRAVRDV
jgi:predicted ATPase